MIVVIVIIVLVVVIVVIVIIVVIVVIVVGQYTSKPLLVFSERVLLPGIGGPSSITSTISRSRNVINIRYWYQYY